LGQAWLARLWELYFGQATVGWDEADASTEMTLNVEAPIDHMRHLKEKGSEKRKEEHRGV
jgi:hypothetical protein